MVDHDELILRSRRLVAESRELINKSRVIDSCFDEQMSKSLDAIATSQDLIRERDKESDTKALKHV